MNTMPTIELQETNNSQTSSKTLPENQIFDDKDFASADSLETIWRIFDDAFEKMAHERLDDALASWVSHKTAQDFTCLTFGMSRAQKVSIFVCLHKYMSLLLSYKFTVVKTHNFHSIVIG